MRASESSYLFSPKARRHPSPIFTAFFKNPKCAEIKILSVHMWWLLSVAPCVHLFYPANEFASVVLLCKYNLLANLSGISPQKQQVLRKNWSILMKDNVYSYKIYSWNQSLDTTTTCPRLTACTREILQTSWPLQCLNKVTHV